MPKFQFTFSLNSIRKRFFATSASSATTAAASVKGLIDAYSLPSESASHISNKLKLSSSDGFKNSVAERLINHCHSVFGLLKEYGFSGNQIAKLIRKRPKLLKVKSEAALKARFQFLEERGFSRKNLCDLIVTNPLVLGMGLETRMHPAWEFLRTCIGCDDKVILAVMRWPWLLTDDLNSKAQPNVVLLMDNGVPLASISKLVVSKPRTILRKPARMSRVIIDLKESGRDPASPMFLCALNVAVSMTEATWNKKMEALKSIGLTEEDTKFLFQKYPLCFACSVEKIRASFDFLVNDMKLDLPSIVARPLVLMYGLEGRVRPRLNVLKVLKSKNLVKGEVNLNLVMTISEEQFIRKYVVPNKELVPDLMDVYRGGSITPQLQ